MVPNFLYGILQRKYRKMTVRWSLSNDSFVKLSLYFVASKLFYHGILQRKYRKMTIRWSFTYDSFVKLSLFCGSQIVLPWNFTSVPSKDHSLITWFIAMNPNIASHRDCTVSQYRLPDLSTKLTEISGKLSLECTVI